MGSEYIVTCGGGLCGYGIASGRIGCTGGDGSCRSAYLIEVNSPAFHPKELKAATRLINRILKWAHPGPKDHTLSFLSTPFGTLLAWVEHPEKKYPRAVTSKNPPEEIAEALGLIVKRGSRSASNCLASLCDYGIVGDTVYCVPGGGNCASAILVNAAETHFHPLKLQIATAAVNGVLRAYQRGPNGETLSFLHTTDMGSLLAWATHVEKKLPKGAVTRKSGDEEIARAFGITDRKDSIAVQHSKK